MRDLMLKRYDIDLFIKKFKFLFLMSKNNFVSVVIPTYNSKKFITKTFLSIINQTYKEFEIIFVDDCSNMELNFYKN